MTDNEFPAPQSGFVVTHFLVVSDQDRSRDFYRSVFGATVVLERDPVILKIANSWLILNVGGSPTDDKPLADIWDICLWITERFRTRWADRCEVSSGAASLV